MVGTFFSKALLFLYNSHETINQSFGNSHLEVFSKNYAKYGADARNNDRAAKEHAVFRGHLEVARLLAIQEFSNHSAPSNLLQPLERRSVAYKRQSSCSQLFIYLGPSHTRNKLEPIELERDSFDYISDASDYPISRVTIEAQGTSDKSSHSIQLPLLENLVNQPVSFLLRTLRRSTLCLTCTVFILQASKAIRKLAPELYFFEVFNKVSHRNAKASSDIIRFPSYRTAQ